MAINFTAKPIPGPAHIVSEPQKSQPAEKLLAPGLEHRPFSDEEIKQAFDTFDLDRNRFVGAAELQHILQLIGEEVTDEEIDEMIRICDTDGDGQVTFDEFYKMMTEPEPPKPPQPAQERQRARHAPAAASKKYRRSATAKSLLSPDTEVLADDSPGAGARRTKTASQQVDSLLAAETAQAQASKMRADSVETLVRKLSGGLNRIKPSQIKKVYKRFMEIDADNSGAIEEKEFMQALGMENNMVSKRMFRVFDMDESGSIELKEFIVMLSRYTTAARSEKLKFAFMMFDEDGSGFIERNELVEMLRASFVVEGYSQAELEDRADRVFDTLNLPRNGAISYQDFQKLSKVQNGLIYPLEEERRTLGKDLSINKLLEEADADGA
mmetsp:Transcript_81522/g.264114  ORF Transcript_81522/g.264114 Transcript_81522/m.264114 type:complete len:382 (-) Transcript_81522:55-1200(-)